MSLYGGSFGPSQSGTGKVHDRNSPVQRAVVMRRIPSPAELAPKVRTKTPEQTDRPTRTCRMWSAGSERDPSGIIGAQAYCSGQTETRGVCSGCPSV